MAASGPFGTLEPPGLNKANRFHCEEDQESALDSRCRLCGPGIEPAAGELHLLNDDRAPEVVCRSNRSGASTLHSRCTGDISWPGPARRGPPPRKEGGGKGNQAGSIGRWEVIMT